MPHALLVDDNTDTLEALTEVLKAEGFTASAAPNLDEAKAALARQTPDVVLLDLNLPDGSGMTLLDGIEGLRAPAVVLITGHASVSTVVEALRRGVTDYLTKPVDVDRLRTILGNIAHTRQLPEEIKALQTERDQSGKFGLLVGRSAEHAPDLRADRPDRAIERQRADQRRERHRQGRRGAHDSRAQPPAATAPSSP